MENLNDIADEIQNMTGDMYEGTITMSEDAFHEYANRIREAAERDFTDTVKRQCFSDVQLFSCDMAYSDGLTQGLVGRKMIKKWREKKREVRT